MTQKKKLRVLLVAGGDSSESDVSVVTGQSVFDAMRQVGHEVLVVDPRRPDIGPTDDPGRLFEDIQVKDTPPNFGDEVLSARRRFLEIFSDRAKWDYDIVFNGLHGGAGEDGTLQSVFDYLGVRYTGSGACACQAAMDKELSKRIVAAGGVTVARHIYVDSPPHESVVVDEQVMESLSLPVVVKPNHEGSSVGVTIVETREALRTAIEAAKAFEGPYLVEQYIPGREITAAVLDRVELPLIEIRPVRGFFDYHNKYQKGACDYLVPAPLNDSVATTVVRAAAAAYRSLGLRIYSRLDFRLSADGQPCFLEANTLPGLTSNSLVPMAARAAGIEFPELVDRILRLSMAGERV